MQRYEFLQVGLAGRLHYNLLNLVLKIGGYALI